mgnify:CR=1 FL=1
MTIATAIGISIQFKINWVSIILIIISSILITELIKFFKKFEKIKKEKLIKKTFKIIT